MKKIFKSNCFLALAALLVLGMASCKKETNGGVQGTIGGKGAPTITRVRTLNKTVTDTLQKVYTTYNSTGQTSSTNNTVIQQVVTGFDSTTTTGKLNNYYVIIGTNLGSTSNIYINGVNIYFNRALNTDNSVVFNIPSNIPYVQPQPNTIKLVTLYGSVTYNFTTLPPPPTIATVSDYNFTAGSTLSFKGQGLASLTAVTFSKSNIPVTIASKTDTTLVLTMPQTTVSRGTLNFTYASGSQSLKTGTSQEFIDLDNNAGGIVFANGVWGTSSGLGSTGQWGDASWQGPSGFSASAPSISGKGALVATYPSNGWKIEGWANWWPGIIQDPSYSFLEFWVKGSTVDQTLYIEGDQMPGGYGQNSSAANNYPIVVKANIWNYFRVPILPPGTANASGIEFWSTAGAQAKQLGFFLKGQGSDPNETMYFDQVVFVK
jgi:hypothetical protein